MSLTKARRARLEKLAAYLESLPADYKHFRMVSYFDGDDSVAEAKYARENGGVPHCGTAACAIGHGPAAGILVPPRFVDQRLGFVDWPSYEDALFIGPDSQLHRWLFASFWRIIDDTHYGAAARIRYFLDKGLPPLGTEYATTNCVALYAPYRVDAKAQADA